MTDKVVSEAGSLKGYKFKIWLSKNKETLKLLVSAAGGLLVAFTANLAPIWAGSLGTLTSCVTKLILDGIDFWLTDVKI